MRWYDGTTLKEMQTQDLPLGPKAWIVDRRLFPSIKDWVLGDLYIEISGGERCKTREQKAQIEDWLCTHAFPRNGCLISVGGGSMSDLVGFIAATYLRGISYRVIPTTLLAMIDASIGGKVGINTLTMKNGIGAFHFPQAIGIDDDWLSSLPKEDWKNGFAELLKYGWVADPSLLAIDPYTTYCNQHQLMIPWILRCMKIKQAIVHQDPRESGLRRILNFGHTLGHALETATDYQIPHGQAIAWGMRIELQLSYVLGFLSVTELEQSITILDRHHFASSFSIPIELLVQALHKDKKNEQQGIRIVLLKAIGYPDPAEGAYCHSVPLPVILESVYAHAHCS